MNRATLVVLAILGGAAPSSSAWAHAQLVEASPRVGSTVAASPAEIRLRFSEGIESRFSGATLSDTAGRQVPGARASVDPGDRTQMVVHVGRPLSPGVYRVNWRVLSVDTHRTQGSFTFEVRP